jgi:hypothetical protein
MKPHSMERGILKGEEAHANISICKGVQLEDIPYFLLHKG